MVNEQWQDLHFQLLMSIELTRVSLKMETLGLQILSIHSIPPCNFRSKTSLGSTLTQKRANPFHHRHTQSDRIVKWRINVVQAVKEDYELKQMKNVAAARKRWELLVREGKVKPLAPREAGYAIQLSDKTLLDVRPATERQKAWVKGSTWIPIFDVDSGFDIGTLSKRSTNFMMGGWWSGVPTLSYNKEFLSKVKEKFPDDVDLIVACQKGLRSLAACEILLSAGYRNLFWVQGGLETAEEEDLQREGPQPLKFAGIGGLSEFLGWTDQQRLAAAKEGWKYRIVFSARLIGLFVVADGLFLAARQMGDYLLDIRPH